MTHVIAFTLSTFASVGIDDGQLLGYVVLLFLVLFVGAAIGVWLRKGIAGKK